MTEEVKDPQQQQDDKNKEAKKFEANWRKVIALFNGDALFKPKKVGKQDVQVALQELVKEEKEEAVRTFKEEAKKLIKEKNEFDAAVKAEQKKAEEAILAKKKEFNKRLENLFAKIDKIQNIERDYYETLRGVATSEVSPSGTEEGKKKETDDNKKDS